MSRCRDISVPHIAGVMSSNENLVEFEPEDIQLDNGFYEAGAGSFGRVWFGFHKTLKVHVAVKIFSVIGGPREKDFIANTIKEEMGHVQAVDHHNIVRVLGCVKLDSAMGIVMEYCPNGSIKYLLLDKRIPLTVGLRVWLLLNIAKALACCHTLQHKCLVHGDVKPDNVLLAALLVCKLCDFGTAQLITLTGSRTVTSSDRSKKEKIQYTPWYTAPEKLKDLGMRPTKALDVYAFALLVHMVLTRDNPYRSGNDKALLDAIKEGLRPNCEAINEWKSTLDDRDKVIVESLEDMMKQCWSENPSERPTMTEVCERLENLLDGQPEAVITQQATDTLAKMEEIYPPPTNLNPQIPLDVMWARKNAPQEFLFLRKEERPTELGDPTRSANDPTKGKDGLTRKVKEFWVSPEVDADVLLYIQKSRTGFDKLHQDLKNLCELHVTDTPKTKLFCFRPIFQNSDRTLEHNQEKFEKKCTWFMNRFFEQFCAKTASYPPSTFRLIRDMFSWTEGDDLLNIEVERNIKLDVYARVVKQSQCEVKFAGLVNDVSAVLRFIDRKFKVANDEERTMKFPIGKFRAIRECNLLARLGSLPLEDLKIALREDERKQNGVVSIKGPERNVDDAVSTISKTAMAEFSSWPVLAMGCRAEFLLAALNNERGGLQPGVVDVRKIVQEIFAHKRIYASLQLVSDTVSFVVCDSVELLSAQRALEELIQQDQFQVESLQEVTGSLEWEEMKRGVCARGAVQLIENVSTCWRLTPSSKAPDPIYTSKFQLYAESIITVVALLSAFPAAWHDVGICIGPRISVTKSFPERTHVITFLRDHLKGHKESAEKLKGVELDFKPEETIIMIKGNVFNAKRVCDWLKGIVARLCIVEKQFPGAGVAQFLRSQNGKEQIDAIGRKHHCVGVVDPQKTLEKVGRSSLEVVVKQGDITASTCEAIVSSTLDMRGVIGKRIMAKAGRSIVHECLNSPIFETSSMRITSGGSLWKYVLHLAIPLYDKQLKSCFIDCLSHADRLLGVESIAVPPVGSGEKGLPSSFVARSLAAAINELNKVKPQKLKRIEAYVFQETMLPDFQRELPTRIADDKQPGMSDSSSNGGKGHASGGGRLPDQDPVRVLFCSWTLENVDKAFKEVE